MDKNDKQIADSYLVRQICDGDKKAFEKLFFDYYYPLCRYAVKITNCSDLARDAVQDVFFKIWKNRQNWKIRVSLKAYLYQAVRNQALRLIESRMINDAQAANEDNELLPEDDLLNNATTSLFMKHLLLRVWKVVKQMPEQRKKVFELHRKHGLTYQEISEVMGIAPKTVENHMGRALQELREEFGTERLSKK